MLYQFIVENFKTFRDEAILNLAAASYDEHPHHVCAGAVKSARILKTAAIYGANASGKTNLMKAVQFARQLIVVGTTGDAPIAVDRFRLNRKSQSDPARFEFIFESDNKVYHYGFVLFPSHIVEEWLIDVTSGTQVPVFKRHTDGEQARVEVVKKVFREGKRRELVQFIANTTRKNQLFLKEAFEKNLEEIKPAFRWFSGSLILIPALADYRSLEFRTKSDQSFSDFLGEVLRSVGTGIDKVEAESLELDFEKYLPDLEEKDRDLIRSFIQKKGEAVAIDDRWGNKFYIHHDPVKGPELLRLRTMHRDETGALVPFDLRDESEGTRRFLNLLPILYDTKSNDRVYFVDELDRRLHPHLTRKFLELFLDPESGNSSQLIFTTHDVHLQDQELLRRDELWFVAKDLESGASELYPLTDMGVRKDLKLDKAYMHGRFGGIPEIVGI